MSIALIVRVVTLVLVAGSFTNATAGDKTASSAAAGDKTARSAQGPATSGPTDIALPPRPTHSQGKVVCQNKTYLISTGTGGGTCVTGMAEGDCTDGANSSSASCAGGCGTNAGKGSCKEQ